MSAIEHVEQQLCVTLPVMATFFESAMETAMSSPAQKGAIESFRDQAKMGDGKQTSSVANKAAQSFVHAVTINMTGDERVQGWCGYKPEVSCGELKVCIMFTALHTLLSES